MEDKMKLCSDMYIGFSSSSIDVLKEDLGLARAIEVAAKIWSRMGVYLAPILEKKYDLTDKSIPKIAAMLTDFLKDKLCFEATLKEASDTKALIMVKPCLEWTKFKEFKLPPLCYRLCYSLMEQLVKHLNADLTFAPGAQIRQGADRCEFIIQKQ
jgi:predicted ArsR family transcriptional regulator